VKAILDAREAAAAGPSILISDRASARREWAGRYRAISAAIPRCGRRILFVAVPPVDLRKGYEGLAQVVRQAISVRNRCLALKRVSGPWFPLPAATTP
jgi:hypothetical protein